MELGVVKTLPVKVCSQDSGISAQILTRVIFGPHNKDPLYRLIVL